MEELSLDQLHYTTFQGSKAPKSKQFEAFLVDIRFFISQQSLKNPHVFFSYAWPKEDDNYKEVWHTNFIRILQDHLKQSAFIISLDQIESIVAHNLNAFMQRIEQSDRVFVFGSQTRDEKLGWTKSGVIHENNLIMACEAAKSVNKPFVVHIGLSNKCKVEPDSLTRKNIPLVTNYLLLLKSVIAETYGFGEEFEQFWQEHLIAHKIMDTLVGIPAQAPNVVKRVGLLKELEEALEKNDRVICVGDVKSGKKQLCLSYVWENYYRYRAVYWLSEKDLFIESPKPQSLIFLLDCYDPENVRRFINEKIKESKVVILANADFMSDDAFRFILVGELLLEEGYALVEKVLGEARLSEGEVLINLVGLKAEPLLFVCGYIQRNRISIKEYLEDYEQHSDEIAQFKLRPIRERKAGVVGQDIDREEENVASRLKRRLKPQDFKSHTTNSRLQIAFPKPDDPVKEKERFETQQVFCRHEGRAGFLRDIHAELNKLELSQKVIFISFAFPADNKPEEKWTEVFVNNLAEHFRSVGVTVYFMHQRNLASYLRGYEHKLHDIHVLVVSTRSRVNNAAILDQDEMLKQCVGEYSEFRKPDQRFIMPIRLTSEKHYDQYYDAFAAYSFYEHEYSRQLRDLMGFIFWVDDSFRDYWRECELKNRLASNWRPSHPAQNPNFVDRKDAVTGQSLLRRIHKHFWFSEELLVISTNGIGGVGKTQLALQFAHLYGYKFKSIFWFSAENREALLQRYAELGVANQLFELEEDKKLPLEERTRLVINWLQNVHQGWLLIIDNAKNYEEIKEWLPSRGGQILVTSRHTEWPGEHNVSVGLFSIEEAREYIQKVLGKGIFESKFDQANQLIELLGRLPLAVAQACAYIKNQNITMAQYLELYKKEKKELQSASFLRDAENHEALLITWTITLREMAREFPESVGLMYLCTQLHHENIPEYLVREFFKSRILSSNSIRVASEYSMINYVEENKMISLHVLVQEVVYSGSSKHEELLYLRVILEIFFIRFPLIHGKDTLKDLSVVRELFHHFKAVLSKIRGIIANPEIDTAQKEKFESHYLNFILVLLGGASESLGQSNEAIIYSEEALSRGEASPEVDQGQLLENLVNLGNSYLGRGEAEKSRKVLERALEIKEKRPNLKLDFLGIRSSLGNAYYRLGKLFEAQVQFEAALKLIEQKSGETDKSDAYTLHSMSILYSDRGESRKAKKLLKKAISIFKKFYEVNHPFLASVQISLGVVYKALGKLDKACSVLEEALDSLRQYYSNNHYRVGMALMELGCVHLAQSHFIEAKNLFKQALKINQSYYGAEHAEVAINLMNLGIAYLKMGEIEKARHMLERAVEMQRVCYGGIESLQLQRSLWQLSCVYGEAHLEKQCKLQTDAISMRKRLGDLNSFEMCSMLLGLAKTYHQLENEDKRCEMLEEGLAISIRNKYWTRNRNSPFFLKSIADLCSIYADQNKARKAFDFLLPCCEILMNDKSLDLSDLFVSEFLKIALNIFIGIANDCIRLGDEPWAKELLEKAWEISQKRREFSNLDTGEIHLQLSKVYASIGDFQGAYETAERACAILHNHASTKEGPIFTREALDVCVNVKPWLLKTQNHKKSFVRAGFVESGYSHLIEGNFHPSIKSYKSSLYFTEKEEVSGVYCDIAFLYCLENNLDLADRYFHHAIKSKIGSHNCYCHYGLFLYKQNKFEQALEYFKISINTCDTFLIYNFLHSSLIDQFLVKEIESSGEISGRTMVFAYYWIILCYHKLGKRAECEENFKKFVGIVEERLSDLSLRLLEYTQIYIEQNLQAPSIQFWQKPSEESDSEDPALAEAIALSLSLNDTPLKK